jgi:putative SOS response-associated peptidase YedK
MFMHPSAGEQFAFAGLWSVWRDPNASQEERDAGGGRLLSCTIITGEPNDKVRPVHDRMPVMLPSDAWETWLDPAVQDIEVATKLLVPAPSSVVDLYPVSTDVNNVRSKDAHLVERVEAMVGDELPGQATLL